MFVMPNARKPLAISFSDAGTYGFEHRTLAEFINSKDAYAHLFFDFGSI